MTQNQKDAIAWAVMEAEKVAREYTKKAKEYRNSSMIDLAQDQFKAAKRVRGYATGLRHLYQPNDQAQATKPAPQNDENKTN